MVSNSAAARQSIVVAGAGAVGCYFGGMLARAGFPVTLIGRAAHMDAVAREGLHLETLAFQERIPVRTATGLAAARGASMVLFSVKTVDTETAALALAPHLDRGAVVVSMQNGVDNVDRIRSATGIRAIPAVVYVAAAMAAPGHVRHSGRGDLVLGNPWQGEEGPPGEAAVDRIAAIFECAAVPCRISTAIRSDLWTKMVMNCAFNAISALGRERYGVIVRSPEARELMERVIEETVAVAHAEGVELSARAMSEAALRLGEVMSGARSSMAQDLERSKTTEIDSLNGYLVRRARELHVPTPVNQALTTLVKLLEGSVTRNTASKSGKY